MRILDAGAGTGILTAAVCERFSRLRSGRNFDFSLWESDSAVIPFLNRTITNCQNSLNAQGHNSTFTVEQDDFVLRNCLEPSDLLSESKEKAFDLAIMNPPYFKLRANSRHARAMASMFRGQPNIYAQFMAVAVNLLRSNGWLISITPRSFCNGLYFRGFRRWLFERMAIDRIHVFECRRDTFREEDVLQESVITAMRRTETQQDAIVISVSKRDALNRSLKSRKVQASLILDNSCGNLFVRVPQDSIDEKIVKAVEQWNDRFEWNGFRISTGPIVLFRSTEHLMNEPLNDADNVPLIGPHNIRPFSLEWPVYKSKWPMSIRANESTQNLLMPASNYVILKRFSAKEERRRLTAGCVFKGDFAAEYLGFENHLNVIYHAEGDLTRTQTIGIAALFNSMFLDRYFRCLSGNTQVNATELRTMRFLSVESIVHIGKQVSTELSPLEIETIVLDVIEVNGEVRAALLDSYDIN